MTPTFINVPKGFYVVFADDSPALGAGYHFTTREAAEKYMNDWMAKYPNPNQRPMKVIEVTSGPEFVDRGDKGID